MVTINRTDRRVKREDSRVQCGRSRSARGRDGEDKKVRTNRLNRREEGG